MPFPGQKEIRNFIFSAFLDSNVAAATEAILQRVDRIKVCKKLQLRKVQTSVHSIFEEAAMKLSVFRLVATVIFLGWLCSVSAGAQVSATLSGRVTDSTGAAVPAATVTANDLDTGVSRTAVTSQAGLYEL